MRPKQNTPTIYDIAAAAGVSPSTVSRVLRGNDYPVTEKTRSRIRQTAQQMGYKGKAASPARLLPETVYVLVPDLCNPFYTLLVSGLEISLRTYQLNMVLINTNWDMQQEISMVTRMADSAVPMIIAPISQDLRHIQAALAKGARIVLIEAALQDQCSGICFNSYAGSTMAVQHLLSRGIRRIAYLSPPLTRYTRVDVYNGFLSAMEAATLPQDPALILISEEETVNDESAFAIGAQMCRQLLSGLDVPPEAIFCENDMIAMGVLQHLRTTDLRVPEDISVIGIDNIPLGTLVTPQLTTIDQCTREMGALAADLIVGQQIDPKRKPVQLLLEPRLVIRESVR